MSDSTSDLIQSITKGEAVTNAYSATKSSTASSDLDKDAFLSLLMAQLQYQDPLDPMDNTEMVAQLAQFSSLEQISNLNTTMTNSASYSMIGKYVYAEYYDETNHQTTSVEGYVDSVTMVNGEAKLVIGDKKVAYDDVKNVYDSATDYTQQINGNIVNSQALELVGKTVQALTTDDDGNVSDYVEGKVDYVTFVNDSPVLHIGGKEVYASDVVSVGDDSLILGKTVSYPTTASSSTSSDEEDEEDGTASGEVEKIVIEGDKIYLEVGDQKIEIEDLSSVMTAFSMVGKNLNLGDVSGEISGVVVRDAIPYVTVGDAEVKYNIAANAL
jgi:flagellar basal-body rod modification protein FlgD